MIFIQLFYAFFGIKRFRSAKGLEGQITKEAQLFKN